MRGSLHDCQTTHLVCVPPKHFLSDCLGAGAGVLAFLFCIPFSFPAITCILDIWADPGVLWKKAPRAMRAMRGKTLETVPFQAYSGCTKSFLKVLSNEYCQATRAMRAKRVVPVPLQPYFGFHSTFPLCNLNMESPKTFRTCHMTPKLAGPQFGCVIWRWLSRFNKGSLPWNGL